jgi:iron-sulfur cluster repair protein YtfE (RIC family)
MERDELRERLLAQHRQLRGLLQNVHEHTERIRAGGGAPAVDGLRNVLRDLRDSTVAHLAEEDACLRPLLPDIDAWGPQRMALMEKEHVAEHQALLRAIEAAAVARTTEELVDAADKSAREFAQHIDVEERFLLNRELLSDFLRPMDFAG